MMLIPNGRDLNPSKNEGGFKYLEIRGKLDTLDIKLHSLKCSSNNREINLKPQFPTLFLLTKHTPKG